MFFGWGVGVLGGMLMPTPGKPGEAFCHKGLSPTLIIDTFLSVPLEQPSKYFRVLQTFERKRVTKVIK